MENRHLDPATYIAYVDAYLLILLIIKLALDSWELTARDLALADTVAAMQFRRDGIPCALFSEWPDFLEPNELCLLEMDGLSKLLLTGGSSFLCLVGIESPLVTFCAEAF